MRGGPEGGELNALGGFISLGGSGSGLGYRLGPVQWVFGVGADLSVCDCHGRIGLGLSHAIQEIPLGTAYAVWTGVGAALTVTYAVITQSETLNPAKAVFLAGIILAVVGLQLADRGKQPKDGERRG